MFSIFETMFLVALIILLVVISYYGVTGWIERKKIRKFDPKYTDKPKILEHDVFRLDCYKMKKEYINKLSDDLTVLPIESNFLPVLTIYITDIKTDLYETFEIQLGRINNKRYPLTDSELKAFKMFINSKPENIETFLCSSEVLELLSNLNKRIEEKELLK